MRFPGWGRIIALGAALCFLGGAIGWALAQPGDESFNDTDVGFLSDMSTHHLGAINLGFDYLGREHDSLVGHFAREIVLSQSQEIAIMNNLFAEAGNPARGGDDVAMDWMGMPVPPEQMPGMPTPAESEQLLGSTGLAADDSFTHLMIRHHAAGAAMAEHAAKHGENEQVRKLATTMARVQHTEINEMNSRRRQLGLAAIEREELDGLVATHGH